MSIFVGTGIYYAMIKSFWRELKEVFFVGIGGVSMSGLAEYLLRKGVSVSGSDISENGRTAALRARGVKIYPSHARENIGNAQAVVCSSAINQNNPERLAAMERGIPCFSSMGAALHLETQSIRVAPLKRTKVCPLAATVRSRLRDMDTGAVTCVYSEEPPLAKPGSRDAHGKSVLGSLPTVPAVFGMTLANEVIKHLLGD